MRIDTVQAKVYTFEELSDDAKEKARDWWREGGLYDEWYDGVYDQYTRAGQAIGIQIDKIYFSGFASQGDGACFEGTYEYQKGWRKLLAKVFGGEAFKEVEKIGDALQAIQAPAFYKLSASVSQSGYYMHSVCTDISVNHDDKFYPSDSEEQDIKDELRNFMDLIYSALEKEYEWLMSNDQVDETIIVNEYEFTENGEIY